MARFVADLDPNDVKIPIGVSKKLGIGQTLYVIITRVDDINGKPQFRQLYGIGEKPEENLCDSCEYYDGKSPCDKWLAKGESASLYREAKKVINCNVYKKLKGANMRDMIPGSVFLSYKPEW